MTAARSPSRFRPQRRGLVMASYKQGAFNADQTELVLTLDSGGTVTIDVPAALRGTGLTAADDYRTCLQGATNSNTEIPSRPRRNPRENIDIERPGLHSFKRWASALGSTLRRHSGDRAGQAASGQRGLAKDIRTSSPNLCHPRRKMASS